MYIFYLRKTRVVFMIFKQKKSAGHLEYTTIFSFRASFFGSGIKNHRISPVAVASACVIIKRTLWPLILWQSGQHRSGSCRWSYGLACVFRAGSGRAVPG